MSITPSVLLSEIGAITERYIKNIDTVGSHTYDHCVEKRGDVGIAPYGWVGGRIAPADAFVAICTLHRRETLGSIVGGDAHIAPPVILNEIGAIAEKCINNIDIKHENINVEKLLSCRVTSI